MDYRVQQAIIFMKGNLHRKLTEKQFARKAGLTAQHFSRLFKAATGQPPMRYLNCLRMEKAREFLESAELSHLSIKQISACVGCRDVSHFVRDFEKRFGLSPKRYRANGTDTAVTWEMPSLSAPKISPEYSDKSIELI